MVDAIDARNSIPDIVKNTNYLGYNAQRARELKKTLYLDDYPRYLTRRLLPNELKTKILADSLAIAATYTPPDKFAKLAETLQNKNELERHFPDLRISVS